MYPLMLVSWQGSQVGEHALWCLSNCAIDISNLKVRQVGHGKKTNFIPSPGKQTYPG